MNSKNVSKKMEIDPYKQELIPVRIDSKIMYFQVKNHWKREQQDRKFIDDFKATTQTLLYNLNKYRERNFITL